MDNSEMFYNIMKEMENYLAEMQLISNEFLQLNKEKIKQVELQYIEFNKKFNELTLLSLKFKELAHVTNYFLEEKNAISDLNTVNTTMALLGIQIDSHYQKIQNAIKNLEFDQQIEKISRTIEEVDKMVLEVGSIKNSLFSFFGLIVGLLAFIFVNYQFISSAKDLGMGKMLMFMGIADVGLVCGILIILGILGDLLGKSKKLKNSYRILKSGWLFLGIISIIVLGFSIDLFDRSEKNQTIDEKINKINERVEMHNADLYNELNKRDLEIEKLKLEIENLKNKK